MHGGQRKARRGNGTERKEKWPDAGREENGADSTRLKQLSTALALRQRQVDALKLKAGIVGVLQQVQVQEGQQVLAGVNLARVARPDVLRAE